MSIGMQMCPTSELLFEGVKWDFFEGGEVFDSG